ncbi:MAG: tripartite tricarboxylate transporter TctB family protein [Pseudomonadota bacterium]
MSRGLSLPKKTGEAIVGFLLALTGLWWAWMSRAFLSEGAAGEVSSGVFPMAIGLLLAGGGLVCGVRALLEARAQKSTGEAVEFQAEALTTLLASVIFGLVFTLLSPVLAGTGFLAFSLNRFGGKRLPRACAIGFAISFVLYLIFDKAIGVQLPQEFLFTLFRE